MLGTDQKEARKYEVTSANLCPLLSHLSTFVQYSQLRLYDGAL